MAAPMAKKKLETQGSTGNLLNPVTA